ncbi:MAG: TIGR02530 family flagellar biosynthesis protein [Ignavibacteriales bacterium]
MAVDGLDGSRRIIPVGAPGPGVDRGRGIATEPGAFQRLLESAIEVGNLKFSAHAQKRIEAGTTPFGAGELKRVAHGVDLAQSKGSGESLVLLDGMALVVSVKNRTVITAVDMQRMKDNVFTNIDSAVIV